MTRSPIAAARCRGRELDLNRGALANGESGGSAPAHHGKGGSGNRRLGDVHRLSARIRDAHALHRRTAHGHASERERRGAGGKDCRAGVVTHWPGGCCACNAGAIRQRDGRQVSRPAWRGCCPRSGENGLSAGTGSRTAGTDDFVALGWHSHGTLSLGSAPMSLLLDNGTKMVQGPSPVRVAVCRPVLRCSRLS